jgi:hypothetical protein
MRLWTIQPVEVVNILERDSVFTCDFVRLQQLALCSEPYLV